MRLKIEKTGARPWDEAQLKELFSEGFPEFVTADRLVKNSPRSARRPRRGTR